MLQQRKLNHEKILKYPFLTITYIEKNKSWIFFLKFHYNNIAFLLLLRKSNNND